ncbi:glycine cleavage T C-terminal barrel domain-containing protein [Arthrobacter globiformis]|uniref:glycine cleavage T C-terminal barrel domain-containing protein n=1 Tax=Arthrobacter globiformis TaxID=1665 RepID=UPI0027938A81|nr:glycine cleavage T C-terminal barrel domain-containing protein [Arthrobacter globiformis]MDQ0618747.1 glycine cleavage system aminomethyltransferase T [Arthrobacter globiformis]
MGRSPAALPETQSCKATEGYNGIFSFTPDGNPLLGEVPGIRGLWLGESVWLTQSAGVAGVLADWIVTGDPGIDTTSLDFRRFDQTHLTRTVSIERASENYDEVYDISHPRKQTRKLRKFATTPFYVRQEALGAVFGTAQGGWERPLWYGSTECPNIAGRRRDAWGTYGWSPAISAEARQAVNGVGLVDRGAASVFEVRGSGAEKHLQEILAPGLSLELNTSTGAFVKSPSGGIAADLTVVRTAEDAYLVIGSSPEDVWHLRRETHHLDGVTVSDVSSATTALALIGPDAAALLASVTRGGIPAVSSPVAPVLDVGGVPVRAVAETTTGVGGWMLYAATEHGLYLWDLLVAAAGKQGMALVGDEAVTALRIANGVPAFGIDFGPQDTAYEAGLAEPSAGAEARPGHRLLVRLRLSSGRHAVVTGEPVSRGGSVVGYITSAAEDPASGRFLAFAWVDPEAARAGTDLEISHLDAAWAAKVDRSPLTTPCHP